MAFLLAKKDRDRHAFIAVVFDVFHFIQTHRNVLAHAQTDFGFCRAGALLFGKLEHVLRHLLDFI